MRDFIIRLSNFRLFQHILFWMSYVMMFGLVYGKFGNDYAFYILESLGMVPFVMASTYITIYLILPYYLREQHFLLSLIYFFGTLLLTCTFQRIFLRYINNLDIVPDKIFDLSFLSLFLETNFMVGIAMAIKLIKKWFDQQKEKFEFEKKSLESELNLLRAQIHPHFLFNTMNNLYSLSLGQSNKTSEGIAKVSDLLQAVLYDCNEVYIDLEKEITFIQNYIDLQRLRYDEQLTLDFRIEGNYQGLKVAPMLFITYIENCFKHGSSNDPDHSWITVLFRIQDKQIFFKAENSKPKQTSGAIKTQLGGIGLENVKKRLDILYKDNYKLNVCESKEMYGVEIELNTTLN